MELTLLMNLLDFAKKCKPYVPQVVLTIVDTTIPPKRCRTM